MSHEIANVKVGKADVSPSKPSHTKGVHQGNATRDLQKHPGFGLVEDTRATGTAARSTGIDPEGREPIDPRMPNLSPP